MNQINQKESEFLERVNQFLPKDINWKQGAIDYLKAICGGEEDLFHYIKPFQGGPDWNDFFDEMYSFLNVVEKVNMPMKSRFLDVACGPGWTSQYLAKLGYSVCGIDISEDLLKIARERMDSEKFRVYPEVPLDAEFLIHDIESKPIDKDSFDCAMFFSALHHFVNPINALRNVSKSLKDDGIICIWEGVAPDHNTVHHKNNMDIMIEYKTLERPYSKTDLVELFNLTGFEYFEFYSQVNGVFNLNSSSDVKRLNSSAQSNLIFNFVIASRKPDFFEKNNRNSICRTDNSNLLLSLIESGESEGFFENTSYIYSIYRRLLNREPDTNALIFYCKQLLSGTSKKDIENFILGSDEYKSKNLI